MNNMQPNIRPLLLTQRTLWYLMLVWFATTTIFSVLGYPIGARMAFWGILLVLAATFVRLIFLSEFFRRSALFRNWLLTYLLALILLTAIAVKYVLL